MPLRFLHSTGLGPTDILHSLGWPVFLLIIIVSAFALLKERLLKANRKNGLSDDVQFRPRPLLTKAETLFLEALEKVTPPHIRIYTQVPLIALVDVVADDLSTRMSNYNRIDRKRVNFVLIDPQTGAVRKVVELDDRSHDRPDRQDRDELVDDVLGRAGIPIVHWPAQAAYDLAKLRETIGEM
jgi:hypothetical protein